MANKEATLELIQNLVNRLDVNDQKFIKDELQKTPLFHKHDHSTSEIIEAINELPDHEKQNAVVELKKAFFPTISNYSNEQLEKLKNVYQIAKLECHPCFIIDFLLDPHFPYARNDPELLNTVLGWNDPNNNAAFLVWTIIHKSLVSFDSDKILLWAIRNKCFCFFTKTLHHFQKINDIHPILQTIHDIKDNNTITDLTNTILPYVDISSVPDLLPKYPKIDFTVFFNYRARTDHL